MHSSKYIVRGIYTVSYMDSHALADVRHHDRLYSALIANFIGTLKRADCSGDFDSENRRQWEVL